MPKIFISYSHDSEAHKVRVGELAKRLRADSIDAVIDQDKLPAGPDEGWPAWCETQASEADILLLVFTETYASCWRGEFPAGMRNGATNETATIRNRVYEAGYYTSFCRVVLFDPSDAQHLPDRIKGLQTFSPDQPSSYQGLLHWLRGPKQATSGPAPAGVVWPEPSPGFTWTLADRGGEFERFQGMLAGRTRQRLLLIRGEGNRGKTVLLAQMLGYAHHQALVRTLVDLKGCPTLEDVLQTILDLGPSCFPGAAQASPTDRASQLLRDLQGLTVPLLLVFDTYEKSSQPVRDWIEGRLLARLERMPAVVLVIAGREIPDASKHVWEPLAAPTELAPIHDVDHWMEWNTRLGRWPEIKREHVEALAHAFRGDPGLLSANIQALGQAKAGGRPETAP